MLIKCYGAAPQGIEAVIVTIEVHAVPGFEFTLVGLPDNAVKESHERIIAALTVNGFSKPRHTLTINMAPADIKKEGASYDLPLAIGFLAAEEEVPTKNLGQYIIMGELSLDGTLQPIQGVLPIALAAKKAGFKGIILPAQNAREAAVVDQLEVYGLNNLQEVVRFLNGTQSFTPVYVDTQAEFQNHAFSSDLDFSDAEMLILPGGATKLHECQPLCDLLVAHNNQDKLIAAICAAPSVLGRLGILQGKQATCYPGFEEYLGESYVDGLVVESKNIITAKGPGLSSDFAFCIIEKTVGPEIADQVYDAAQY